MRVLLVTYYFPPCGGASVQRWLRFIPLLMDSGLDIEVLTPENGDYPYLDETLLELLPKSLKIHRTKNIGFGKLWKWLFGKSESLPYGSLDSSQRDNLLKWIAYQFRLHFVYPDMRRLWNTAAYKYASQLLKSQKYDLIITTGPPHSTHLIGLKLKKRYGIKWISDFRDPWTQIYYLKLTPPNRIIRYLNERLERLVVKSSDLNIVVSKNICSQLPEGKKVVLYNGFDDKEFACVTYQPANVFRIKFIGQLTQGQKIDDIISILESFAVNRNVSVSFIGTKDAQLIRKNQSLVKIINFIPHAQAIEEMIQSELLLLIINDYLGNHGMLTTKLFEYIGSRTPILCFGPTDGEAAEVITKLNAGKIYTAVQEKEVNDYLIKLYSAWSKGCTIRNTSNIEEVSVKNQISVLNKYIAKVIINN